MYDNIDITNDDDDVNDFIDIRHNSDDDLENDLLPPFASEND